MLQVPNRVKLVALVKMPAAILGPSLALFAFPVAHAVVAGVAIRAAERGLFYQFGRAQSRNYSALDKTEDVHVGAAVRTTVRAER
jgi:hypothetical protein